MEIVTTVTVSMVLENYTKKCKSTVGGLKKIYLLPFVEYTRSQIKESVGVLTQFPESYIYQFDCEGSYSQQSSVEGGGVLFEQSVELKLSEVYNILDINIFVGSEFRVVVETNNGLLLMLGARNGLECSASNNSGTNKAEFNGFSLDFKGKEKKAALLIDNLSNLGLYLSGDEFNYDFNFDL